MQETWVRSLGWKDPLEEEITIHSSILTWEIPCIEEPGRGTVHGVAKESNTAEQLNNNSSSSEGNTHSLEVKSGFTS